MEISTLRRVSRVCIKLSFRKRSLIPQQPLPIELPRSFSPPTAKEASPSKQATTYHDRLNWKEKGSRMFSDQNANFFWEFSGFIGGAPSPLQGEAWQRCTETHGIIESWRLEKTSETTKSNRQPKNTMPTKPSPKVQYLHVFWTLGEDELWWPGSLLQTTLCCWRAAAATGLRPEVALQNQRHQHRPGFPHREVDVGSSAWARCSRWNWKRKIWLFQWAEGGRSTGWKSEKPQTRHTAKYFIALLLINFLCRDSEQLRWKPDAETRVNPPVLFILVSVRIITTDPTDLHMHHWKTILQIISFHLCHITEISFFSGASGQLPVAIPVSPVTSASSLSLHDLPF